MHIHQLNKWQHDHVFLNDEASQANEKRTLYVVILTLVMMLIEISAGIVFNSMALLADGWHMATHAGALALTVFAYRFARRHKHERRFTFGVGKVEILGGYSNAIILGLVALFMVYESIERMLNPLPIAFNEAMLVAILGLIVNLISAWLLHADGHHHHHGHSHHGHSHHHHDHGHSNHHEHAHHAHDEHRHEHLHDHAHDHAHDHEVSHKHQHDHAHEQTHEAKDHNLQAAYLHVLADALTSILAITALLLGKSFGWNWTDAAMGIVGALVISKWAYGLLRETGSILLDQVPDQHLSEEITRRIESDADNRLVDQHLWYVGSDRFSAILSVVTHYPRDPEHYKRLLADIPSIAHVTVEVNECKGEPCIPVPELEAQGA